MQHDAISQGLITQDTHVIYLCNIILPLMALGMPWSDGSMEHPQSTCLSQRKKIMYIYTIIQNKECIPCRWTKSSCVCDIYIYIVFDWFFSWFSLSFNVFHHISFTKWYLCIWNLESRFYYLLSKRTEKFYSPTFIKWISWDCCLF